MTIPRSKEAIRNSILRQRNTLSAKEVKSKSTLIINNLLSLEALKQANTILLYSPINNEVDISIIYKQLWLMDKDIFLPTTIKNEIIPHLYTETDTLQVGRFNVLESPNIITLQSVPDIIVVPIVAADKNNNRIGYGKGYYDRYLNGSKVTKIGLCYEFQIIDNIPTEKHDQKLDIIITEKNHSILS